jgi:hypothetical protein
MLLGVWGVISAFKDASKLEPPFRYMLTWPRAMANKLKDVLGHVLAVTVIFMVVSMAVVTGLVVGLMRFLAPS